MSLKLAVLTTGMGVDALTRKEDADGLTIQFEGEQPVRRDCTKDPRNPIRDPSRGLVLRQNGSRLALPAGYRPRLAWPGRQNERSDPCRRLP